MAGKKSIYGVGANSENIGHQFKFSDDHYQNRNLDMSKKII
jgi:hypothetical protein